MTFPIFVKAEKGHFTAALLGMPDLIAVEATRAQAIATLQAELQKRIEEGELLALEVKPLGVSDTAGIFRDDPTLRDICEEAYRLRDSELAS